MKPLEDRFRVLKAIAARIRPQGFVAVGVAVAWTLLGAWREEVPSRLQPPLLWDLWERVAPSTWLTLAMALLLLLEAAYRQISWPEGEVVSPDVASVHPTADKGLLDFIPDGNKAMNEFADHLSRVGRSTADIGVKLKRHTKRILEVGDDPSRRRSRAADAAKNINEHAAVLEKRVPLMRSCAETFGESFISYFQSLMRQRSTGSVKRSRTSEVRSPK